MLIISLYLKLPIVPVSETVSSLLSPLLPSRVNDVASTVSDVVLKNILFKTFCSKNKPCAWYKTLNNTGAKANPNTAIKTFFKIFWPLISPLLILSGSIIPCKIA